MDMSSASVPNPTTSPSNPADSSMSIIFFTSTTTPLYSASWTPSNTGQYAGTCIFLIILATVFRALFAIRAILERRWEQMESERRYVIAGVEGEKEGKDSKMGLEVERSGSEGNVVIMRRTSSKVRPWRTTQDIPRACLDVLVAGVGYLLMLAVMTANIGYFISILGGTFLGNLIAGRFFA